MSRAKVWGRALVVAVSLAMICASRGLAQQQTGDLFGTVVDEQKAPLPGVTVTLTGVGAPQVQQTDEGGRFRFVGLYPGTYALKAELEGFGSVDHPNIGVRVGGKAEVEVTLSSAVKEMITVTDEAPLLNERQASHGSNLAATELNKVPTARDPWSLLSQAPAVQIDRFNIGGNESGQQSMFLGAGSGSRDNVFAVDGVVLTDMNAVGGSATYFDFGAFEEVQFTTSSSDVSVATAGVTINQVTKRGTNAWRVNGRYLRTDGSLQSEPDLPNGNKIDNVEEYGADLGGPIVKDHLWIWGSYGKSDIRNLAPSPSSETERLFDKTLLEDTNVKLNFQLGATNSGVLHYWTNDKQKFGRVFTFLGDPLQEATHNQTTPSDIYKLEDTWIPSASLVLTGLWSRDTGKFTLTPQGGLDADVLTDVDGILHGSSFDFKQDATIDQYRVDGGYFFSTGSLNHELKFGAGFRQQDNASITTFPHQQRTIQLADQEPDATQMVVFIRDRTVALQSSYESAWLQDTLQSDRWTVNFGLRYDNQYGKNKPITNAGNPDAEGMLPPLSFAGNDAGGFKWDTLAPRLGVTYAAGDDRKTLLRASFSRYAEQLGQNPQLIRVSPTANYSYAYFYFADANGNLKLDQAERGSLYFYYGYGFDPANPGALTTANVNSKDLQPYITDELTFGVEHAFTSDLLLGATFTYRNIHDIAELRPYVVDAASGAQRLATRADYVLKDDPTTATLPDGTPVVKPLYELRQGLTATGGSLLTNGDRTQDYKGLTLSLQRRLHDRWSARGHVTYNDWKWKMG